MCTLELDQVTDVSQFELEQLRVVANKCDAGEGPVDGVRQVLRGRKNIVLVDAVIQLFDHSGRRIPPAGLKASVCNPNTSFCLVKPEKIDFAERLQRLADAFERKDVGISPAQFEDGFNATLVQIPDDLEFQDMRVDCAGISNGVCLPLVVLQQVFEDYGTQLDDVLLVAAERAYRAQYSDRGFTNHRHSDLAKKVTIVPGMRHEQLMERAKQGNVVVPYFPNPLQGYSVHADREQMATLPDTFALAGGLDGITALAMYPDVLAYGWNAPGNDFAALQWQDSDFSLCCKASDGKFGFGNYGSLGDARDYSSGGLSVLG